MRNILEQISKYSKWLLMGSEFLTMAVDFLSRFVEDEPVKSIDVNTQNDEEEQ